MALNKVEICGVDTSKLPLLKEEEKNALFAKIKAGDEGAKEQYRYASNFDVGEHVRILGRIQSREYVKKLSETETETRTAYEVSVSKLECIDE